MGSIDGEIPAVWFLISSIGFIILTIIQFRNTGKSFNTIFLSIIFLTFGAYGMLVLAEICINSTETIGGRSIGFLAKKGKLKAVIIIKTRCDTEDIIILLFTSYLSLYGSDISATLVKPDPDNKPIISNTLP